MVISENSVTNDLIFSSKNANPKKYALFLITFEST